ncbi:MAG: glycosyltransferase [Tildeniella torsiva UHER 1998/13D]|jgi:glycosyltransferase involved in cell wall biosynthesis|nr:glycosyltransferase [Tildeniella torsiva UHER 1998/13D]
MTKSSSSNNSIHVWVPNLFEFKGGIQVYLCDILAALEYFHEHNDITLDDVTILNKLDSKRPEDLFSADYFSFEFTGQWPKALQTLAFTLKTLVAAWQQRPCLIVCGHLNFAPVAYLLHRLLGIPYWILVYGVDAWSIQDSFRCQALRATKKVISISGYTRDRLIQEQGLSLDKISLLPVTFNFSRFHIKPKPDYLLARYNIKADQPIILTVSRLADDEQYNGYDQVIKAILLIRQKIPDIHYILVGKGSDRPRIERMIAKLDIQDCVTLAGFVADDELCDHYNLCDVFAMPSKSEGFGIVYLEALACGKPTVGGNQDGAIDALCNGELGILVDPDDVAQIASRLIEILRGESLHPLIYQPEVLRRKVDEIYGFERFQEKLLDLLKEFHFAAQ